MIVMVKTGFVEHVIKAVRGHEIHLVRAVKVLKAEGRNNKRKRLT